MPTLYQRLCQSNPEYFVRDRPSGHLMLHMPLLRQGPKANQIWAQIREEAERDWRRQEQAERLQANKPTKRPSTTHARPRYRAPRRRMTASPAAKRTTRRTACHGRTGPPGEGGEGEPPPRTTGDSLSTIGRLL
jgi:hypothetical protein